MQPNTSSASHLTCLTLLVAAPLFSQSAPVDPLAAFNIKAKVDKADYDLKKLANVLDDFPAEFLSYLRSPELGAFSATFKPMLQAVENGRVDEQGGASAAAGGVASAAEKAGLTGLLTAAMESGAMAQTLDQNLLTVRGNGEGLSRFLSGQDVLPVCTDARHDTSCDPSPLNNLELTASFDVSKSNTQNVDGQNPLNGASLSAVLTSGKRQFSSATARYSIINSRDLRSAKYRTAWLDWYKANSAALARVGGDLLTALFDVSGPVIKTTSPGDSQKSVYKVWMEGAEKALTEVSPRTEAKVSAVFAHQLDLLVAEMRKLDPALDNKAVSARNAYSRYFANTRAGIALGNQPMLTVEASYSEPSLQPKLITSKFVFAWSPKSKGTANSGTVTINGGISTYTKAQPKDTKGNTTVWRDAQFALQFDRPFGGANAPATLSFGTYIQYQMSPGLINIPSGTVAPFTNIPLPGNATQLLAKQGTVAVAHASLTLQIPNSGIKVPIGISWSNRTELLTGSEIRGHIGFTFDTHSLLLAH